VKETLSPSTGIYRRSVTEPETEKEQIEACSRISESFGLDNLLKNIESAVTSIIDRYCRDLNLNLSPVEEEFYSSFNILSDEVRRRVAMHKKIDRARERTRQIDESLTREQRQALINELREAERAYGAEHVQIQVKHLRDTVISGDARRAALDGIRLGALCEELNVRMVESLAAIGRAQKLAGQAGKRFSYYGREPKELWKDWQIQANKLHENEPKLSFRKIASWIAKRFGFDERTVRSHISNPSRFPGNPS
jgi:hypothetical protein